MWVPKAKPVGVGEAVHRGSVVRTRDSRKQFFARCSSREIPRGKTSARGCDRADMGCSGAAPVHLTRLGQELADLFWVFGEVVFDVAEAEGAEDRFFGLAIEEKFERGFDEALGGGRASVFGEFQR